MKTISNDIRNDLILRDILAAPPTLNASQWADKTNAKQSDAKKAWERTKYEIQIRADQTPENAEIMAMSAQQCPRCGRVHPSLDDMAYCDCTLEPKSMA